MPRPLVALAILADSAGALLMTRRTPASRRRLQLRARADADEAEELRRIFESGADLLTPEEEMANEDAREGVASVFDAEDMRTLFHEGLAAEGDAPRAGRVFGFTPLPLALVPGRVFRFEPFLLGLVLGRDFL